MELTKDKYKYFSIGHNGHCHGSMSFHGNRPNNEAGCIDSGEHSAGMDDHEYVYQIKADAATRKNENVFWFNSIQKRLKSNDDELCTLKL